MKDCPAPREACEATRNLIPAAALDALSDADMHQVTAHVDGCQPCRAELASMRRVAAQLTYAAPLEPVDRAGIDGVRARLHARALDDGRHPHEPMRALERERREQAATVASLQTELSTRDTLLRALANPDVRVITLTTPAPHAAAALMFWNRATDRWTFVAHDLPLLDAGRVYQLWLVLESRPLSIGLLSPDAQGNARMDVQVPVDGSAHPQVAVTNEPAGGSPRPTGEPVIAGSATR